MLRSFTLSLAGHAALIAALLLFTASRPVMRIADLPRSARLVTHFELPSAPARPAPAAPSRVPQVETPARRPSPAPASRPAARRAPTREEAAVPAPPRPVAVPKILVPTREKTPPPAPARTEAPNALSERLAKRLASAAPPAARAPEVVQPKVAGLPAPRREEPPQPAALASAPSPSLVAGLPAGPVVPLANFPYAWYIALLQERVFGRWTPPSEFYLEGRNVAALVAFRIDRAGRPGRVALKEGSGYARFDRSALAAVEGLRDLPPLPDQYREDTLDVVIRFQSRQDGR